MSWRKRSEWYSAEILPDGGPASYIPCRRDAPGDQVFVAATPQRVLLTGATGFVGSHVAEAFVRAGWAVRALARSRERAQTLAALGVEVVDGALEDEHALLAAVDGTD